MSMDFELNELTKKLKQLENKAAKKIAKPTLMAGSEELEKALSNEAPVNTGELKRNVKKAKNIKTKKGANTIDIGVMSSNGTPRKVIERAYYQHYGSRSRAGTYWLNEGFNKGIKPAKEKMIEVLKEELK